MVGDSEETGKEDVFVEGLGYSESSHCEGLHQQPRPFSSPSTWASRLGHR